MRLLVDTCIFLRLTGVGESLPDSTLDALEEAELVLSTVARIEIAIKVGAGKLDLLQDGAPIAEEYYWNESLRRLQPKTVLSIEPGHIRHLATLPRLHKDPFDRILICQSLSTELPIITTDAEFVRYGCKVVHPDQFASRESEQQFAATRTRLKDDEEL